MAYREPSIPPGRCERHAAMLSTARCSSCECALCDDCTAFASFRVLCPRCADRARAWRRFVRRAGLGLGTSIVLLAVALGFALLGAYSAPTTVYALEPARCDVDALKREVSAAIGRLSRCTDETHAASLQHCSNAVFDVLRAKHDEQCLTMGIDRELMQACMLRRASDVLSCE
jgi:hypothetical protein